MPSREQIIDALPQRKLPGFDLHLVAGLHQGKGHLPEGLCDMGIGAPVRIEGEQDSLNTKSLQDW
jgi:hypothetical protein